MNILYFWKKYGKIGKVTYGASHFWVRRAYEYGKNQILRKGQPYPGN